MNLRETEVRIGGRWTCFWILSNGQV